MGGSVRRKGWLSKNGTVALTARTGCSQAPEYSVGKAAGGVPQENLNMTNGAP